MATEVLDIVMRLVAAGSETAWPSTARSLFAELGARLYDPA